MFTKQKMPKHHRIAYLLIVLPILIYFVVVDGFAVNIFFADDFHLLKTIVWSQEVDTFSEKIKLFFQQHNEHRIIFPRLLAQLDYWIEGQINWRTLIWLGNLAWCGVLFFLWQIFVQSKAKIKQNPLVNPWHFVLVPFVFLQAQYYDNLTWTLSILQQSLIVFWAALFIYLLSYQRFYWALAISFVATFTHGNGLFLYLVAFAMLIFQKKWQHLGLWLVVFLTLILLYFSDYRSGQNSNLGQSLADPIRLINGFFAFWGSGMGVFSTNPNASVLVGMLIFGCLSTFVLYPIKLKYFTTQQPILTPTELQILGFYIFISITAALVSLSRSWGGVQDILMPRYEHYSPLALCLVYLLVLNWLQKNKAWAVNGVVIGFTAFGLVFGAMSYFVNISELDFRKKTLEAEAHNWHQHQTFLSYPLSFNQNIDSVYLKAEQRNICKMPKTKIFVSKPILDNKIKLDVNILNAQEKDASRQVNRKFIILESNTLTNTQFLILVKDSKQYFFPVQNNRNSKKNFLSTLNYFRPGFKTFILTENLPKGNYKINIMGNDLREITQQLTL